jgi:tetratricopeptide (TPR) repeat protein
MNNMSRDLELEQQIDAYLKGKLNEEEAHELWAKLLERPDYIELLETELGVKSILTERSVNNESDTSSAEEQSIIYHLKASKKWIAAAAAVAVLVVAINFLQMNTTNNIGDLALKDINIAENLSSAQILRSQKAEIEPADSLLNRGFEAAISGDVDQALKYYDLIIQRHSESASAVKAYLNKGIIQYNSGNFEESITSFESVLDKVSEKPIVREKAYWYLGNALINLDELKEAREAIHTTYAIDGIYRKPAFRLLKKLDHELGNVDLDNVEQQLKEE